MAPRAGSGSVRRLSGVSILAAVLLIGVYVESVLMFAWLLLLGGDE